MIVYFTAAASLRDAYGEAYSRIVKRLEQLDYKVIHQHVTNLDKSKVEKSSPNERKQYYSQVMKWISEADVIVAELSFPSTLNVGHEVTLAIEKGKPVIGLYASGKQSMFFQGIKSEKFVYEEYTPETLDKVLEDALKYAQENSDTRFNFIVPHSILDYLDWVSQHKNLPRSVYLRNLIEQDMKKNKEYTK